MKKVPLKYSLNLDNNFYLKLIDINDLETIRIWKNKNSNYFFHTEIITKDLQLDWYSKYILRDEDYMFVILKDNVVFGCMGIRKIDLQWDIYNVILGIESYGKRGYMSKAFKKMNDFSQEIYSLPITLKVLKHNPAVSWYLKNNFVITSIDENYYSMLLLNKLKL